MEPRERITLAFVERLLLNETGQDYDSWSREHMEDVAQALDKVDQPGAAGLLRSKWAAFQELKEQMARDCTCAAGGASTCPSHGTRRAPRPDNQSTKK